MKQKNAEAGEHSFQSSQACAAAPVPSRRPAGTHASSRLPHSTWSKSQKQGAGMQLPLHHTCKQSRTGNETSHAAQTRTWPGLNKTKRERGGQMVRCFGGAKFPRVSLISLEDHGPGGSQAARPTGCRWVASGCSGCRRQRCLIHALLLAAVDQGSDAPIPNQHPRGSTELIDVVHHNCVCACVRAYVWKAGCLSC